MPAYNASICICICICIWLVFVFVFISKYKFFICIGIQICHYKTFTPRSDWTCGMSVHNCNWFLYSKYSASRLYFSLHWKFTPWLAGHWTHHQNRIPAKCKRSTFHLDLVFLEVIRCTCSSQWLWLQWSDSYPRSLPRLNSSSSLANKSVPRNLYI